MNKPWITFPPDWKWITVGFCYFVLGHLFPISLMNLLSSGGGLFYAITGAWSFGGLAVVAFIIGYRSKNIAVVEAVIASILYTLVMNVAVMKMWTGTFQLSGFRWMVMILAISIISATIGEVIQSMKERPSQENPETVSP
ncbi:MAG: hypothetical protein WCX28_08220 [Bacteriovoracaceae bacterium]|nr:hypothetical protein [Bacteroidota bacterium]